jgi:D-amino peptidase
MTLDRHYSAIVFVGQHSMANVQRGIMAHSFSSLGIQNMLVNGKPVGEIGIVSALAGHFDTPVILLTGDRAAADEIKGIIPDVELAAVKESLGRYDCISLSARDSQNLIRAAAERAARKIEKIAPYRIPGPVTLQIEFTTRNSLPLDARLREGAQVIDDRTIKYTGKDILEAWTRYRRP